MIKNYLTIAWRHLLRHKGYAAINVFGLALGITCCLLILLWVQDERGVDNFHARGNDLYVAYATYTSHDKTDGSYNTPRSYDLAAKRPIFYIQHAVNAVPGVSHVVLYEKGYELPWGHPESFQAGDKILRLPGSRATSDFFQVFNYPLIEGTAATALSDVRNIAISRKMAEAFFGGPHQAIGKTLRYENRVDFRVSGVFENVPTQSSLRFEFILPWQAQESSLLEYASNDYSAYVQLDDHADPAVVTAAINAYLRPQLPREKGVEVQIGLQRFGEQYLHDTFADGHPSGGRIAYVRLFSGIAIFILLIACINFMNLATARSMTRAKEVGLRKVVGSTRGPLIAQFLSEAFVFACLGLVLSIVLLVLLLPVFNHFTEKQIALPLGQPLFWGYALALVLVTGLVAGSYPALYLSGLQPIRILKGVVRFSQGTILFRKSLTVFQFVLSIVLIAATLVITRQVSYVQHARLGYDKENLIYVRIEGDLIKQRNYELFKQLASGMPGIAMIDRATEAIHNMDFVISDTSIKWEGRRPDEQLDVKPASVGWDFVRIMGMEISRGRDFSRSVSTDSADAFLINEAAAREMGMKEPLGKWVSAWKKKGHIIGVIKDFHTASLHDPIKPILLDVKEYEDFGMILARTKPGETKAAIASLEKVYKQVNPAYAFSYQFVDEEYKKLYTSELIISRLTVAFSSLAIFISCLGLLGLVMLTAQQRTKEIGVRKVLGASVGQIVALFTRDMLALVVVAFLIAAPLAWFATDSWLRNFAYRIALSWWVFVLAGVGVLGVALLTMSYQAIKAALANPVKALRSE